MKWKNDEAKFLVIRGATFYTHWQEIPKFSIHWRIKRYKQTIDVAVILFGRWFGVEYDWGY